MTNVMVLESEVRRWADGVLPGRPGVTNRAAAIAGAAYERGASVDQACRLARSYVASCLRHPSSGRGPTGVRRCRLP